MKRNIYPKLNKYRLLSVRNSYDPTRIERTKGLILSKNPRGLINAFTIEEAIKKFININYPSVEQLKYYNHSPSMEDKKLFIGYRRHVLERFNLEYLEAASFTFNINKKDRTFLIVKVN